ncbi:MAG TPA: Xaa-Pro peptidase family protein, partial [Alphaproteobacteria bacterium]|nr:Xaa-Pro peptidase family protein [Alphaproteobacteria bacterium]
MFAPDEYRDRLGRLRAEMAAAGAKLAVVDHGELLAYLTGFTISETRYRACLVPLEGEPWCVLRSLDVPPCRERTWIREVIGFPDWADPVAFIAETVAARGHAGSVIAVDDDSYSFTARTAERWRDALPGARFVTLTGIGDRLRRRKSAAEIELLSRAADVADGVMEALQCSVEPGWTARQAAALAASEALRRGADTGDVGPVLKATGDSGFLHGHLVDDPLQPGDVLHVELVPKVLGYCARIMRPIVVGAPSVRLVDMASAIIKVQDAQFAAMRPGASAAAVDAVMRDGLRAQGLRSDYDNVTGYQLGLYARTPRVSDFSLCFHPGAEWTLEEGMVFHMYTSAAGLAFSDTILVTAAGGRRLTR